MNVDELEAYLETEISLFENDFGGEHDEQARLLHKHYKRILDLIRSLRK